MITRLQHILLSPDFRLPLFVLVGMLLYGLGLVLQMPMIATVVILVSIVVGTYDLFLETFQSLLKRHFALDYIAIVAILVAVFTGELWVAAILALMIASGRSLESFGVSSAKSSLTALIERIPQEVTVWLSEKETQKKHSEKVEIGERILIRKGEVVPLDGELVTEIGVVDESSLTGEPYPVEKITGDLIRSGTINTGEMMVIRVTKLEKDSTYKKIIKLVQNAHEERSPLVRLADTYSTYFTGITFLIALFAYFYSGGQLVSVLAVLAVATPCPLIIATPIALLGGVNHAAKKRIIIKKLASLEALSRTSAIVFDKTGTITIGKPKVTSFERNDTEYSEKELFQIVHAIERNSLHPLAKALSDYVSEKKLSPLHAEMVKEEIGKGIRGKVKGKEYILSKLETEEGMSIGIFEEKKLLGKFTFRDEIKPSSRSVIHKLQEIGMSVFMFTGDKKEAAEKVITTLGIPVILRAQCSPEDKQEGIKQLKRDGKTTAMVGDGINDAPALALADVGMVFSNEEQTAATDAADVIFLGGDFSSVVDSYFIAKRTVAIAMQSIRWGIGLSVVAMIFAAFGLIPPLLGAGIQELIDVAVILNALRAAK